LPGKISGFWSSPCMSSNSQAGWRTLSRKTRCQVPRHVVFGIAKKNRSDYHGNRELCSFRVSILKCAFGARRWSISLGCTSRAPGRVARQIQSGKPWISGTDFSLRRCVSSPRQRFLRRRLAQKTTGRTKAVRCSRFGRFNSFIPRNRILCSTRTISGARRAGSRIREAEPREDSQMRRGSGIREAREASEIAGDSGVVQVLSAEVSGTREGSEMAAALGIVPRSPDISEGAASRIEAVLSGALRFLAIVGLTAMGIGAMRLAATCHACSGVQPTISPIMRISASMCLLRTFNGSNMAPIFCSST
jgi:hypothetical protein